MNSYLEICEAGSDVSCYVLGALAVISLLYVSRWLLKRIKP